MSSEQDPVGPWERIAAELRICRESQQKAWGDIDNATLGRYLAGEASSDERASVETALDELPELRKLTDLVRDVLNDLEPVSFHEPAESSAPAVLPFSSAPSRRRRVLSFLHRRSSLLAACCLLLICSLAMPRPSFLAAPEAQTRPNLAEGFASRSLLARAENSEKAPVERGSRLERGVKDFAFSPDGRFQLLDAKHLARVWGEVDRQPAALTPRQVVAIQRDVARNEVHADLPQAVPQLSQTHQVYQRRFGHNHPATRQTARALAGVYQTALNCRPQATRASKTGLALAGAVGSNDAPGAAWPNPMIAIREQITNRTSQEVQTAVVPVLVEALENARTAQERQDIIRALAALGPAASNAVGALQVRLHKADDPAEIRLVVHALNEMGPAACKAVPTLLAMSHACRPHGKALLHSRGSRPLAPVRSAKFKVRGLTPSEGQLAEQVAACLNSPEGSSGIDDRGGCFNVRTLQQSTRTIRQTAKKAGVQVLFATTASADEARKESACPSCETGRAVRIVFDRKGTVVGVQVSPALRDDGVTPEKIRQRLMPCLRMHQYDKAVEAGVRFVADTAAGK